jgi:hypothetical protein
MQRGASIRVNTSGGRGVRTLQNINSARQRRTVRSQLLQDWVGCCFGPAGEADRTRRGVSVQVLLLLMVLLLRLRGGRDSDRQDVLIVGVVFIHRSALGRARGGKVHGGLCIQGSSEDVGKVMVLEVDCGPPDPGDVEVHEDAGGVSGGERRRTEGRDKVGPSCVERRPGTKDYFAAFAIHAAEEVGSRELVDADEERGVTLCGVRRGSGAILDKVPGRGGREEEVGGDGGKVHETEGVHKCEKATRARADVGRQLRAEGCGEVDERDETVDGVRQGCGQV